MLYRVFSGVGENITTLKIPYFKGSMRGQLFRVTDFTTFFNYSNYLKSYDVNLSIII